MDSPISDPKPKRVCLSLLGFLPLVAAMVLFAIARHTVLVPPNRVVPLFTKPTIIEMIALALLVPAAVVGLVILHKVLFGNILWSDVAAALAPLYLLLLYPLRVFVLFPLRVPAPFGVLMTPRPLLWLSLSLCACEFLRSALQSPRVELWLFSRIREKPPLFVASTLFVVTFVVFGAVTCHNNRGEMLVGDEPHYLFIMQSIKQFHTAELTQLLKLPEEDLPPGIVRVRPHKSRQSAEGHNYSIHNIGLPLLMVVPHTLAGLHGVMFFFCAVTALLVANIFLLGFEITGRKWMSALVAALVGLSCPFAFYFRCVYPDVVAALFVIYAFRVVRRESPRLAAVLLAGGAAAFLPWLHAKYVLFAATLFVGAVVMQRRAPLKLAAFAGPFLVSAPLLILFFHTAYGSWLPSAQYGTDSPPVSRFFWRGAPGAFFDRNHGLLAFAPIYFLAVAGLASFVRKHRRDLVLISVLTLPSFVAFSSHWMWWGGPCPPGRFIMPLLPFAAPALVLALTQLTSRICQLTAAAAAAMGIGVFLLSIRFADTLTTHKHIFTYCSTAWNAFPCLPNFFIHRRDPVPAHSFALLACWLVPVAILVIYGLRQQREERAAHCRLVVPLLAAFVVLPGLLALLAQQLGDTRPVAAFNYRVGEYAQPLIRSGIDPRKYSPPCGPQQLEVHIPQKNRILLEVDESEAATSRSVDTPFMEVLYPVVYELDCFVTGAYTNGHRIGRIAILTHKNELVAAADVTTTESTLVQLEFCPDAILPQTRIRYTLNRPGSLEFQSLDLGIRAGQLDQK